MSCVLFFILMVVLIAPIEMNLIVEPDSYEEIFYSDIQKPVDKTNQIQCWKLKRCKPEAYSEKLCGLEDNTMRLRFFDNKCEILRRNCKKNELYKPVELSICKMKNKFMATGGDEKLTLDALPAIKKIVISDRFKKYQKYLRTAQP